MTDGSPTGRDQSLSGSILERYLDGELDTPQRQSFERELAQDPALRAQVRLQTQIDDSIRRANPPVEVSMATRGTSAQLTAQDASAPASAAVKRRHSLGVLAIAAVVVLGASAGVYLAFFSTQRAPFDQATEVYASIVKSGFVPREVCTDTQAFKDWMVRKHDQAMVIPKDLPGIELVGWDYKRVLTPRTGVLLARVDGREVLVLIDDRSNARRLGGGDGLHLFRRTLGKVVLYEVSPLDHARLISHATIPSS